MLHENVDGYTLIVIRAALYRHVDSSFAAGFQRDHTWLNVYLENVGRLGDRDGLQSNVKDATASARKIDFLVGRDRANERFFFSITPRSQTLFGNGGRADDLHVGRVLRRIGRSR